MDINMRNTFERKHRAFPSFGRAGLGSLRLLGISEVVPCGVAMKRMQRMEEVLTLSARSEYRRFLSTERGARSYQRFQRMLYGDRDTLVHEILERAVRKVVEGRPRAALLDVGCGDGKRTATICREIERWGVPVEVEVVEQSPVFVEDIRRKVASGELSAQIFAGRFEAYTSERQFDVVLAIHSIFGIEGGDAILRLLALRKSGGRLLVASNATGSLLGRLKRSLDTEYSVGRLEVDGVREQLSSLGVGYRVERFFTRWSVPSDGDEEVERLVSEWLGLGRFEMLNRDSQGEFREILWSNAQKRDGRIEWDEEEELVIV
ncbi:MAG: methyltransferase domain-containing protein [Chloroflexi bacterium]|nr:MAG: methyltransferase domain-containing protein [Chloroflexota bacterium]